MLVKIAMGFSALAVTMIPLSCSSESGPATVSEIRRINQGMSITADCSHLQLYSQLNASIKKEVENGFAANCSGDDANRLEQYIERAVAVCKQPGSIASVTLTVSQKCANFVNSVKSDLLTSAAKASSSGPITIAEISNLASKASSIAECFGISAIVTALTEAPDQDDVAAFNAACTRDDYNVLTQFGDQALNTCQNDSIAAARALLQNPPALSSPACLNLILRTFGN